MASSLGQYCINVTDLDRSVAFYEALGLECTSRTEIPQAFEAIVERPGHGGKLQLAQQKEQALPLELGNAFWKLYVEHPGHRRDVRGGDRCRAPPSRASREQLDRWPVTVAFVRDLDGYLVELVERHPWRDGDPDRRRVARPVLPQRHRHRADDRVLRAARPHLHEPHGDPAGATRRSSSSPARAGSCSSRSSRTWAGRSTWARCGSSTSTPTTPRRLHAAATEAGAPVTGARRCGSTGGRSRSPSSATPTATRSSSCNGTPTGDR